MNRRTSLIIYYKIMEKLQDNNDIIILYTYCMIIFIFIVAVIFFIQQRRWWSIFTNEREIKLKMITFSGVHPLIFFVYLWGIMKQGIINYDEPRKIHRININEIWTQQQATSFIFIVSVSVWKDTGRGRGREIERGTYSRSIVLSA